MNELINGTKPNKTGLGAFYTIQQGNGMGLLYRPQKPHGGYYKTLNTPLLVHSCMLPRYLYCFQISMNYIWVLQCCDF